MPGDRKQGHEEEELTEQFTLLHNEEISDSYRLPGILRMQESPMLRRRVMWLEWWSGGQGMHSEFRWQNLLGNVHLEDREEDGVRY